eukprot:UN11194
MPLKIVRKVEKEMANDEKQNKEYLPISGDAEYVRLSQTLILGEKCKRLTDGCVAGVQGISGTGSLRLCFNFIKNNFAAKNDQCKILISDPTWGNHKKNYQKSWITV